MVPWSCDWNGPIIWFHGHVTETEQLDDYLVTGLNRTNQMVTWSRDWNGPIKKVPCSCDWNRPIRWLPCRPKHSNLFSVCIRNKKDQCLCPILRFFHPDRIEFCKSLSPFFSRKWERTDFNEMPYAVLFQLLCAFLNVVGTCQYFPPQI